MREDHRSFASAQPGSCCLLLGAYYSYVCFWLGRKIGIIFAFATAEIEFEVQCRAHRKQKLSGLGLADEGGQWVINWIWELTLFFFWNAEFQTGKTGRFYI